jgi:hypothetical protein
MVLDPYTGRENSQDFAPPKSFELHAYVFFGTLVFHKLLAGCPSVDPA